MSGNFQLKARTKSEGKTLQYCLLKSFTFRFSLSFQLKFSRHDNSPLNLEFCKGNARAPKSFAFFQFTQWIFINFWGCRIHACLQCGQRSRVRPRLETPWLSSLPDLSRRSRSVCSWLRSYSRSSCRPLIGPRWISRLRRRFQQASCRHATSAPTLRS